MGMIPCLVYDTNDGPIMILRMVRNDFFSQKAVSLRLQKVPATKRIRLQRNYHLLSMIPNLKAQSLGVMKQYPPA